MPTVHAVRRVAELVCAPVDASRARGYGFARARPAAAARSVAALGLLAALGCAARSEAPPPEPPSPELATEAMAGTAPRAPLLVRFDWTLRERDGRFSGQGAARVAPGPRARLDLFGPRGESYVSAVALGGDLRLPARAEAESLPPAPLLWSALGVLLPPGDASLVGTQQDGDRLRLEYARGEQRWRYELVGGQLRSAELTGPNAVRQTVELEGRGALGLPTRVLYRDWAEFRELVLTLKEAEHVESFPPEIWTLGAP